MPPMTTPPTPRPNPGATAAGRLLRPGATCRLTFSSSSSPDSHSKPCSASGQLASTSMRSSTPHPSSPSPPPPPSPPSSSLTPNSPPPPHASTTLPLQVARYLSLPLRRRHRHRLLLRPRPRLLLLAGRLPLRQPSHPILPDRPLPCPQFHLRALIPSSSSGAGGNTECYKLCLISDSPTWSASSLFVYSSISNLWTEFRSPEPFHRCNSQQEADFSNGSLYFTTREPFSGKRFDLSAGEWGSPTAPLPHGLTFIRVASSGGQEGKVYRVGGVGADGIARSLNVWQLGEEGREWALLETLPELMARRFFAVCYHNYEHLYCVWHEGMICICCYTWPEVLVYRVRRATWRWLERCPLLPEKWSCGFRWFSFRPDLYALV